MMTVILNVAATVGLSIAALFGTNERIIGPNSYFAAKNSTLHARSREELRADKRKIVVQPAIQIDAAALASTEAMVDEILYDARSLEITERAALTLATH